MKTNLDTDHTDAPLIIDVGQTTMEMLFSDRYKRKTILVIVWSVIMGVGGILLGNFEGVGLFFLPIIVFYSYIWNKVHGDLMKQFAALNGFAYQSKLSLETLGGQLFNRGQERRATHGVIGKYGDYPIRIFNYHYSEGSGKSRHSYSFTVCEIEIQKTYFPHIFLRSKTMPRYVVSTKFGISKDVKISLEKEFADYFDLYASRGYEIEVFQIFTPEFLSFLILHGKMFSIEFAGNKVYVFDNLIVSNSNELRGLYQIVGAIIEKIGPLLQRLGDDFDALHQRYLEHS